jgi:hypothetical protein
VNNSFQVHGMARTAVVAASVAHCPSNSQYAYEQQVFVSTDKQAYTAVVPGGTSLAVRIHEGSSLSLA